MTEEGSNEKFVRWQKLIISEMGKVINLFLTITIASLGFVVTQLVESDFKFKNCWDYVFLIAGTTLLLINIVIILLLILNRLDDFRKTAQITRESDSRTKTRLREQTKILGEKTWTLFNYSLLTFGIAELLIISGFAIQILVR